VQTFVHCYVYDDHYRLSTDISPESQMYTRKPMTTRCYGGETRSRVKQGYNCCNKGASLQFWSYHVDLPDEYYYRKYSHECLQPQKITPKQTIGKQDSVHLQS
jgi:hypothetical protein